MRAALPLLAGCLLAPCAAHAQDDGTIRLPGVTIVVGPGRTPRTASPEGNCYGPCPDFQAPSDMPDFEPRVAVPPPTQDAPPAGAPPAGGTAGPVTLSPAQAAMANELNTSRAEREGTISRLPSGGSAASGVAVLNAFIMGLTPQFVMPQQLRDGDLQVLDALSALVAAGRGWKGVPSVAVPTVLGEAEFRKQLHERMLDPLFRNVRMDNRQQFYDGFAGPAVASYAAAVDAARGEFFPVVIARLDALRSTLAQRIEGDDELVRLRLAANRPTADIRDIELSIAMSSRALAVTPDELMLERTPEYLRRNAYLLAPADRPVGLVAAAPPRPADARAADAAAFARIDATVPVSPQGVRAKAAADRLAQAAYIASVAGDAEKAERFRAMALSVLDVATSLLPIVGPARFLYEGLTGTDLFTGRTLSDNERALRILLAAAGGVLQVGTGAAMESILAGAAEREAGAALSETAVEAVKAMERRLASQAPAVSEANATRLRRLFDKVDDWRPGADRNGVPVDLDLPGIAVTEREADELGYLLVGENRIGYQNGRGDVNLGSADGLAQYRMPRAKSGGGYEANYQIRLEQGDTNWTVNGHLTVKPPGP